MVEDQETEFEEQTGEEDTEVSTNTAGVDQLSLITEQLEELKLTMATQLRASQAAKAPEADPAALTNEQILEFQKNPAAMLAWVTSQTKRSESKISNEFAKHQYDVKSEIEYPAIKTDKQFQQAVVRQMQEYINNGEYSKDHPMLQYRAAQMVAGKMNVKKSMSKTQTTEQLTSSAPSTSRGPGGSQSGKAQVKANDPRVVFAELAGLDGKKLEQFKQSLGPYTPSTRKVGRTLTRGGSR